MLILVAVQREPHWLHSVVAVAVVEIVEMTVETGLWLAARFRASAAD